MLQDSSASANRVYMLFGMVAPMNAQPGVSGTARRSLRSTHASGEKQKARVAMQTGALVRRLNNRATRGGERDTGTQGQNTLRCVCYKHGRQGSRRSAPDCAPPWPCAYRALRKQTFPAIQNRDTSQVT